MRLGKRSANVHAWQGRTRPSYVKGLAPLGERVLFAAADGASGSELWISSPDSRSAQLVRDLQAGPASSLRHHDLANGPEHGRLEAVRLMPEGSAAGNWAFDVTPARLVAGLITERGVCAASEAGLAGLFPEQTA